MSHVPIDVDAINWDQFLNLQEGGQRTNTDYFVGERYMRGYGVLGSIGKFLLPIAKNLASSVGNEAVSSGSKILTDVTQGRNFTEALKEHSQKGLENLSEKIKQCGKGDKQLGRGRGRKKKLLKFYEKKHIVNMYPARPASPTHSSAFNHPPSSKRSRKRDQLD